MAKWTTITLKEVIENISRGRIVLPVIQRELVWEQEKIIALFETVLKAESFGGIMTVVDPAKRPPLFEFRNFISHFFQSQLIESKKIDKLEEETTYVIDGQQRLSAFYIGIKGEYNNESLYLDLLGESDKNNFNFEFGKDTTKLSKMVDNFDGTEKLKPLWYRVADLYTKFEDGGYDHKSFIDDFAFELDENMPIDRKKKIEDNLYKMQIAFFNNPIVGLCGVPVNRNIDIIQNRLNIVRLFQKLNQGGTILSGIELMRSVLKAYSADNEKFLNEIKDKYTDIGFNQDEIIKLIFLLQDNHSKDIIEIDQTDSDFIQTKGERIKKCLEGTRAFLKHAGIYEYVIASRPSLIPLTFITYHLFHLDTEQPANYFDNHETGNPNFHAIRNWYVISLLNHVFQRGNGWNPSITGRKKILDVLKLYKNSIFPTDLLYNVYRNHSLNKFDDKVNEAWEWLNWYERSLVVYLIYGKPTNFRQNDIDHIHPKSILEKKGVEWNKINILGNFQYLYYSDNRSKQDVEFGVWLNSLFGQDIEKLNEYLNIHCIPNDSSLWCTDRFDDFIESRRVMIYNKLVKQI
ncbi:MAG: DUF262 domain-containing protein [Candidatus Paceibacterota bacterium]|jgi:uncharacterized protein with ParB-like and HNH nuclease domain